MKRVELYARVRHAVMIEGLSQREAARRFGIDPRTVKKMLRYSVPPGYVRTHPPVRPKLDPFKGNDKGKVEGLVGYCRRNFLVPMPRFATFDELNAHLEACCRKRWAERLRGHKEIIGERLARDRAILRRLPATPYDACDKRPGRVSSLSLVRYRGTDYSVPTRFGHCAVLVRGYVHEVVISCGAEVIARHPRSYAQEDFVFDPLHYLSLLERKTNALDQAAPLVGWILPPVFADLRRLLEARMGKKGKREYVQVLRLIETFSLDDENAAISDALARGVIGFDAVKHLVPCRIERRPPRLNLMAYPYLPRAEVATTSARSYISRTRRSLSGSTKGSELEPAGFGASQSSPWPASS